MSSACALLDGLMAKLRATSLWYIFLLMIAAAQLLTLFIISVMALLFNRTITYDYVLTGSIAALVCAIIVPSIILCFIKKLEEKEVALEESKGKLRDYAQQLEDVNKQLENYTYTVSHDLKEPLRNIEGFSTFLQEDYGDKLDDTGKDHLNMILTSTQRMTLMIDDLLKLSRIGRKNTEFTLVDVNEVLEEVQVELEVLIESSNARIEYSGLPKIMCQRTWLSEIFKNLISNALKYNKSTTPTVIIKYAEKEDEYEFRVTDNGIGIDPKYYDKIFQLFERIPNQSKYDGTGAGLAIVKSIVEHHSGKISVGKGKDDMGAEFKFTISKSLKQ
ncbi:MAG: ATP-binding protein [Candidatus Altiarchaeota archaeon]